MSFAVIGGAPVSPPFKDMDARRDVLYVPAVCGPVGPRGAGIDSATFVHFLFPVPAAARRTAGRVETKRVGEALRMHVRIVERDCRARRAPLGGLNAAGCTVGLITRGAGAIVKAAVDERSCGVGGG